MKNIVLLIIALLISVPQVSCDTESAEKQVNGILEKLETSNSVARKEAHEHLRQAGESGNTVFVDALSEKLSSGGAESRYSAALALGIMAKASPGVLATVQRLLNEGDVVTKIYAALAIAEAGPVANDAGTVLVKALAADDERLTAAVSYAANKIGGLDTSASAELQKLLLNSENEGVLACAIYVLAESGDITPGDMALLTDMLGQNYSNRVRNAALYALGRSGNSGMTAIPHLTTALYDSSPVIRENAVRALGAMIMYDEHAVISPLISALEDSEWTVRAAAAQQLGRVDETANRAIHPLVSAVTDSVWYVRTVVGTALHRMHADPDIVLSRAIEVLRFNPDPYLRKYAAVVLRNYGEEAENAVPALIAAMDDSSWFVRAAICDVFTELAPKSHEAIPVIAAALVDTSLHGGEIRLRGHAARALGAMGEYAREHEHLLVEALSDSLWMVRMHAAAALGEMGPSTVESVLKLTETLDDEDTLVRNAAAKALADMDIPKPALSEPNNGRRAAAKGDRESL